MNITNVNDLKTASGEMHDTEFKESDFGYDPERKVFVLRSYSPDIPGKQFRLEFYNVEKYQPINLEEVRALKATAGVFDRIIMKKHGTELTLLSQDLQIRLWLSQLEGKFEIINTQGRS